MPPPRPDGLWLWPAMAVRYGETPTFLDLPTINNVSEASVVGNGAQPAHFEPEVRTRA